MDLVYPSNPESSPTLLNRAKPASPVADPASQDLAENKLVPMGDDSTLANRVCGLQAELEIVNGQVLALTELNESLESDLKALRVTHVGINGVIRNQQADMRTMALAGTRLIRGHPGRVGDVIHQYFSITGGALASLSLTLEHGSRAEIRDVVRRVTLAFNALRSKFDHVADSSRAITGSFAETDPIMSLMRRYLQHEVPTLERALIGRPFTRLEEVPLPLGTEPLMLAGSIVTGRGDVVNVPEAPAAPPNTPATPRPQDPRKRPSSGVDSLPDKPGPSKRPQINGPLPVLGRRFFYFL
ncbi:hypothetical protein K435DRAFT_878679 [Dendrothele bispora CBS 962.96]|uniref:Uncharacterized protein n=1 Tax=Dendrothele bispora (strain CBS 962.96) TaxID=1314807 RepID=A0A4V4HAT9_DENBC|nr:hypothetical protein K435DRAFT_878679 [Dendrothele bispora CBS 962.96]